jgi:hypothetical protein
MELEIIRPLFKQYGIEDVLEKIRHYLRSHYYRKSYGYNEAPYGKKYPDIPFLYGFGSYETQYYYLILHDTGYVSSTERHFLFLTLRDYIKNRNGLEKNERKQLINKNEKYDIKIHFATDNHSHPAMYVYAQCQYLWDGPTN